MNLFFRQIAFNDVSDLTSVMKDAGLTSTLNQQQQNPGAPNDEMYLRQAEHLMKRGAFEPALVYLHKSLTMNPQSKVTHCAIWDNYRVRKPIVAELKISG